MYGLIVLAVISFSIYGFVVYTYGAMRASRVIHYKLVTSLLGSTFRLVDGTLDIYDQRTDRPADGLMSLQHRGSLPGALRTFNQVIYIRSRLSYL